MTVPWEGEYNPAVHLSYRDLAYNQQQKPSMVSILLQRTKTDQAYQGVKVILARTVGNLCPVEALLSYLGHRGHNPGSLFRWADGSPLTRAQLVVEVRRALQKAGLPEKNYTGHSFHIGAATTAAVAGVEDAMIQALGRWKSSAFLTYIRTNPRQMSKVSRSLAGTAI